MKPATVSSHPALRIRGLRALRPRMVALPVCGKASMDGKEGKAKA